RPELGGSDKRRCAEVSKLVSNRPDLPLPRLGWLAPLPALTLIAIGCGSTPHPPPADPAGFTVAAYGDSLTAGFCHAGGGWAGGLGALQRRSRRRARRAETKRGWERPGHRHQSSDQPARPGDTCERLARRRDDVGHE